MCAAAAAAAKWCSARGLAFALGSKCSAFALGSKCSAFALGLALGAEGVSLSLPMSLSLSMHTLCRATPAGSCAGWKP